MAVDVVWHPSSEAHDPGPGHPESPARIEAVLRELRSDAYRSIVTMHQANPAPRKALERVHSAEHIDTLEALGAAGGGRIDQDTVMNAFSFDAALHAAGAAMDAAHRAVAGTPSFAAVRPPGHHATADVAMGFCLFNNVVVAARHALDELALARVLIIDWDVHHGNGTQALVERDPRIRYVSLHQYPHYPGTGRADERGVGNVFNVPRPPGLPPERYVADLNEAVDAATDEWAPDLLLISAGFDAMAGDPLAGFTLEPEHYAAWVERWRGLGSPIGAVLEGGYVPARIAAAAARMVQALA